MSKINSLFNTIIIATSLFSFIAMPMPYMPLYPQDIPGFKDRLRRTKERLLDWFDFLD